MSEVQSPPRLRALRVAAWWALVAGHLELAAIGFRKLGLGREVEVGIDALWMTLVANLLVVGVIAGVVGLLFAFVQARTGGRTPAGAVGASGAGATLAALGVLLHYGQIHPAAAFVLALGVSVQAARAAQRDPERMRRAMSATWWPLVVSAIALAVIARSWWWVAEHRARAKQTAPRAGSPNVLLVVMDTVRASSTSLHGHVRSTTPYLEELAREGTRFDLAFSTSPWTLPSHGSLFTGRYPHELSCEHTTALDDTHPVLAEHLFRHGYRTGGFVANLHYCCRSFGLDRGFARYEDFVPYGDELLFHSIVLRIAANDALVRRWWGHTKPIGFRPAGDINRRFLAWLDEVDPDRPFFGFLNYMDAHDPYFQPEPYASRFSADTGQPDSALWQYHARGAHRLSDDARSPADVARQERAYEGGIALMDDAIRELMAGLEARGLLRNTLVVVTSDHGEQLGEHGSLGHGQSVYRVETHVPLVVRLPRGAPPHGQRVARPVTLRDMPATIVDVIGLADGAPFPGRSLFVEAARGGSPVLSSLGRSSRTREPAEMHALVAGTRRAIVEGARSLRLFDLSDRAEANDLSTTPDGQRHMAAALRELDALLSR